MEVLSLSKPLVVGKNYLVPCFVSEKLKIKFLTEEECWLDNWGEDVQIHSSGRPYYVVPIRQFLVIYPTLHSDKENGQFHSHYHQDTRWEPHSSYGKTYEMIDDPRPTVEDLRSYTKMDLVLTFSRLFEFTATPVELIGNSKLKHDCIYKGKCPHRGHDLTNVPIINGVITCPLHGLQFDAATKKIINR